MISINQPTVVLFDVDGTLIDCGGAGRRAMEATFRELDANTDALGFTFAGLTDRAIVRSGLQRFAVTWITIRDTRRAETTRGNLAS